MPEGDTIYKVAAVMRPDVEGKRLVGVELDGRPAPSLERLVLEVDTVGKHLLLALEGGETIRVHLGMHGSWHRYRTGEPWRRPKHRASIRFAAGRWVFVCFDAMRVDFLDARQVMLLRRELELDLLGDAPFDGDAILRRARQLHRASDLVLDVLLDQRVAAGIGNVYKSEVLHLEGVDPRTPVAAVPDAKLEALYRRAHDLLRENLGSGKRVTTPSPEGAHRATPRRPDERYWVYGRSGRPCLRCGTPVEYARLGKSRRDTYWCPRCQPAPSTG